MSTTLAPRHRGPSRYGSLTSRVALAVVAACACTAALVAGVAYGTGADKSAVVLPLAAAVGVALAALAFTRYATFVLMLLAARPSLDLVKLSGASAGNTDTNAVSTRGLDPASMLSILFIVASLFWLLAQYSSGRPLRGSPVRTALLALVGAGAISVIGADPWQAAFLEVTRIGSVAMMFIVLEQLITSRATLLKVLYAVYASVLFPLAYTTFGLVFGDPASEVKGSFTRLTGPFAQSNTFARYLAILVVFGIALYPVISKRLRLALLPVLALSTVFLLLTLTRSAIIAGVLAVVVIALVQRRTGLIIGFAASALLAAALVPGLGARFATLSAGEQVVGRPETGNSLQWRFDYWTQVLPLANDNPVTGIGLNMTQYQTSAQKQPHNDFIRAYVETGLVGLAAYVSLHFLLVRNAIMALQRSRPGSLENGVAAGALGVTLCFLLASLGSNMMSNVVSLWYIVAVSAAASYVARSRSDDPLRESRSVLR